MCNTRDNIAFRNSYWKSLFCMNLIVTILVGTTDISSSKQELVVCLHCSLLSALCQQICGWCDDTNPSEVGVPLLKRQKRNLLNIVRMESSLANDMFVEKKNITMSQKVQTQPIDLNPITKYIIKNYSMTVWNRSQSRNCTSGNNHWYGTRYVSLNSSVYVTWSQATKTTVSKPWQLENELISWLQHTLFRYVSPLWGI